MTASYNFRVYLQVDDGTILTTEPSVTTVQQTSEVLSTEAGDVSTTDGGVESTTPEEVYESSSANTSVGDSNQVIFAVSDTTDDR